MTTSTVPMTRNAPESILQSQVIQLAKMNGFRVHHARPVQQANGRWLTAIAGDAGFPDLVLAHPERGVLFLELKAEKGKLSEAQIQWGHSLSKFVEYYLIRPQDLEKLAKRLGAPR
jgi:hypothetical protein